MLVVCDTYDHTDYPVYVESDQNVLEVLKEHDGTNMRRVMECYALHLDKEAQLSEHRAFHTEKKNADERKALGL